MSVLKRINQVLFTLIALLIFSSIAPGLFREITYFFSTDEQSEPLSDQAVIELVNKNIITQTISHNEGGWAWSEKKHLKTGGTEEVNSPYYIIPISHVSLKNDLTITAQASDYLALGKMDLYNGKTAYMGNSELNYNNILIYNSTNNSIRKIFNQRILIKNFLQFQFHDKHFMIIETKKLAKEKNTSNDLNTDIHVYKYQDQSLTKLNMPMLDDITFISDNNLPFILIHARMDFDKNGRVDDYDPMRLYTWDYNTGKIKPFLNDKMTENLQKTLDGRNLIQ